MNTSTKIRKCSFHRLAIVAGHVEPAFGAIPQARWNPPGSFTLAYSGHGNLRNSPLSIWLSQVFRNGRVFWQPRGCRGRIGEKICNNPGVIWNEFRENTTSGCHIRRNRVLLDPPGQRGMTMAGTSEPAWEAILRGPSGESGHQSTEVRDKDGKLDHETPFLWT